MKYFKLYEDYTSYQGKDLIIVDIQPEYEKTFTFDTYDFVNFLNDNYETLNSITIFYNGYQTLGMIEEGDYTMWLMENGLNEDVLNYITFYDKGYAFFRYCIDSNIADDITINLIKYMIENNITETRDLDDSAWDDLIDFYKNEGVDMSDVRTLLEHSDDMIYIPELMYELKKLPTNNILLTGGHVEECLREVVLALKALNIDYELLDEFIY